MDQEKYKQHKVLVRHIVTSHHKMKGDFKVKFRSVDKILYDVTFKELGKGSYGRVVLITIKQARKHVGTICVAEKEQKADINFKREVELLWRMYKSKGLRLKPIIYDSFTIGNKGFIILPKMDGDLHNIGKISDNDLISLLQQQVYTINYIHEKLKYRHCDAHNGNWMYFNTPLSKPFKIPGLSDFSVTKGKYTVFLYDPGMSSRTSRAKGECVPASYDYYRIVSDHAGWSSTQNLTKSQRELVDGLRIVILSMNGVVNYKQNDWDIKFKDSVQSDIVARSMLTTIELWKNKSNVF